MFYPIPRPKRFDFTQAYCRIPAAIRCEEAEFMPAITSFCAYAAKAWGVEFREDDGGICVVYDWSLEWDYRIEVTDVVTVTAGDPEGLNHAFATLLQIGEAEDGQIGFYRGIAEDLPDSAWRGISLDLARGWYPMEYVFKIADLCWFYKIDRLQLHLTDTENVRFPFVSYPDAVSEQHYTPVQIRSLVRYCEDRGVTLVPELDAPGHCLPFNRAYPDTFGTTENVMRASEKTFDALKELYGELAEAFPNSPWIHVGGDEVDHAKWEADEETCRYCKEHDVPIGKLYGHYVRRLTDIVRDLDRDPLVWEGFPKECNDLISKDVTVFGWESLYQLAPDLLAAGFPVLNASWKPLYIVPRKKMWDPEVILKWEKNRWENWWEKSPASVAPIVVPEDSPIDGGQVCVWGDVMKHAQKEEPLEDLLNEELGDIRPRLPALAEKTWNSYYEPDIPAFMEDWKRLDPVYGKLIEK